MQIMSYRKWESYEEKEGFFPQDIWREYFLQIAVCFPLGDYLIFSFDYPWCFNYYV